MKRLTIGSAAFAITDTDGKNKMQYYVCVDPFFTSDGKPCVFLATDINNKNTYRRWSQKTLENKGFTIA